MGEFTEQAKAEYDKLQKQLEKKEQEAKDIRNKMRPFKLFLEESGSMEKQTRNRNGSQPVPVG